MRDALFLSAFRTTHLPHAMVAAAVVSILTVASMPLVASRVSPRRLIASLFSVSGIALGLEWGLLGLSARSGALAVYLHTSVLGPILITTFWSLVNERFDPHRAKSAIAPITGGGTLGGVLGGLAAWRASSILSVSTAVLVLAAINIACAIGVLAIPPQSDVRTSAKRDRPSRGAASSEDRSGGDHAAGADVRSAFGLLRRIPFLRNLALLVAFGAIISSLLDYVLGVQAVAHYGRGPGLLWFFSVFGLVVSVASLVVQLAFGRIAFEKVSLAVHLAVLPGVVVLGGALGLAVPGLVSAAVLRGSEMVHRNTLFRSAYELLYTPISEAQKRATKAVIDVGFDRVGTVVGSLVTMAVIYVFAANQLVMLGVVVVVALVSLPVIVRLHSGYVATLKERLLEGAEGAPVSEPMPGSVDPDDGERERLVRAAAQLGGNAADGLLRAQLESKARALDLPRELLAQDRTRVRRALARLDDRDRAAASYATLLLAEPDLARDAAHALRRLAPRIRGQLLDLLLDARVDVMVRRRIPTILGAAPSALVVEGLVGALDDARFEVRFAVGRALRRLAASSQLEMPRERILKALLDETARAEETFSSIEEEEDVDPNPLDIVIRDRISRQLDHVFTLLALVIDGEAARLCLRALYQEDDRYRGAALEYLQVVLPPEVREAVWPLLGETSGPLPTPRPASEVLEDLSRALRGQPRAAE